MNNSTYRLIAQSLVTAPDGLSEQQLVRETGLARQTVRTALSQLELTRLATRPARYVIPEGGLKIRSTIPADDLVPRPWHIPVPGEKYRELTSMQLLDMLRKSATAFAAWELDPKKPATREELAGYLPGLAGGVLELAGRLAAVASRPDWYEALGGNVGVASFEDVDTTELP